MIYAVYRCLYGEDFIQESIKSIDDYVDKIFVFWDDKPWGDPVDVMYKGHRVTFPTKFDSILDKIMELNNPKVHLIYDHQKNNLNQFSNLVNYQILPNYDRPDTIMVIEVDHVFKKDQLEKAIQESKIRSHISTIPIELWKTPLFRIPERHRLCTVFWNMRINDTMPKTGRHADVSGMHWIPAKTHNFGFCYNPATMLWKHLTALAFSAKIGDDMPNEDWYEKTWLTWDYNTNNKNLEISKGYEHNIDHAFHYNPEELPEIIRQKYNV